MKVDIRVTRQPDWASYRRGAGKAIQSTASEITEMVLNAVKAEAPMATGKMKASHRAQLRGEQGNLIVAKALSRGKSPQNYVPYVWKGTRFYRGNPWVERTLGQTRDRIRAAAIRRPYFVRI